MLHQLLSFFKVPRFLEIRGGWGATTHTNLPGELNILPRSNFGVGTHVRYVPGINEKGGSNKRHAREGVLTVKMLLVPSHMFALVMVRVRIVKNELGGSAAQQELRGWGGLQ